MFVLSKLFWAVAAPGNLFLILLCLAAWRVRGNMDGRGRRIVAGLAIFAVLVAVLPFGQWLLLPLENRFPTVNVPPVRVDGIVVLGGPIKPGLSRARGQLALGGGVERLLFAARLARQYPKARLIFTGGSGTLFQPDLKEAPIARQVFADLGLAQAIAAGRVAFEGEARNTYENAVLSKRLADPQANEVWLLVTSARHMPRAMGSFRRAGWRILAYPVDYATDGIFRLSAGFNFAGGLGALAGALKEWTGLLLYRLAGRTDALFPGPQPPK